MRVLVFDPFHGAAGDMITGALLDCGADRETVLRAMRAVVADPSVAPVLRAGIRALKIDTKATPVHRTFEEVMARLDGAAREIPGPALAMARRVFDRIRAAEEEVHGAHVHFHEVGADDAIADVVGACTALYTLAVEGVQILPVNLGHGTAEGSHGAFPIPAPATAVILKDASLIVAGSSHAGELCTPTGAALLAEFARMKADDGGPFTIRAIGYGAGTRDPRHAPNVLRVLLTETSEAPVPMTDDTVDLLETNVDDVSGEVIAHALSRFMDSGARDASAIPVIMKKGRPGHLIRVISPPALSMDLAALMASELGTLGVRCLPAVHRFVAERTIEQIDVEVRGQRRTMPVKCGWMQGSCYVLKAEFDPAREWAVEMGIPVNEVLRCIEEAGWRTVNTPPAGPGA